MLSCNNKKVNVHERAFSKYSLHSHGLERLSAVAMVLKELFLRIEGFLNPEKSLFERERHDVLSGKPYAGQGALTAPPRGACAASI